MNRVGVCVASAVMLLSATAAHAASCGDQPDQAAMNECADRSYRNADTALNATYRQVSARLRSYPGTAQHLVSAQRAWIAFRDAECGFESGPLAGGSLRPFIELQCLEAITRQRTTQLDAFLNCPEGDLACPVPPP